MGHTGVLLPVGTGFRNDRPKDMQGRKRLECKLDGVRVLAVFNGNGCTLYSRNGKAFENFPRYRSSWKKTVTCSHMVPAPEEVRVGWRDRGRIIPETHATSTSQE
jgi:hypothetical protein